MHWIRWALWASAVTAAGCMPSAISANAGGAGRLGLSRDNDGMSVGPHVAGVVHFARDRGMAAGAELESPWMLESNELGAQDRWSIEALLGHVWSPLPHRGPVGFELWGHGGYGRFPVGDRTAGAVVLGPRLGVPFRFESSAPIWDAERMVWASAMLVPSLGASFHIPLRDADDSAPRSELTAHLTFRLYFWSSLMP